MAATRPMTRRDVARGIAAAAAGLACPALAQGAAHVVVIGGGFGGASCARTLRQLDGKLQVSLDMNPTVRITLWGALLGGTFLNLVQILVQPEFENVSYCGVIEIRSESPR